MWAQPASCTPFMLKGIYFHAALANDLADHGLCQLWLIANSCCMEGGGPPGGIRRGALEGQATAPTDPRTPPRWAPCHLSVVEAFDACVFLKKWEIYQKPIFLSPICVGASSW